MVAGSWHFHVVNPPRFADLAKAALFGLAMWEPRELLQSAVVVDAAASLVIQGTLQSQRCNAGYSDPNLTILDAFERP